MAAVSNRRLQLPLGALALASLIAAAGSAPDAQAAEFGIIRPLQHGPVGDSPQYAGIDEYDGEAMIGLSRYWGKSTINEDAESKISGSSVKTRVATGGGWAPSKAFTLTGFVDFTLASDADEEQTRTDPDAKLDTGLYRHEAALFGTYKGGPLLLGGGIGVLIFGSETREFAYDGETYTQNVTSAAMPTMRLYGGVTTKQFDGTIGLRLFSMGEAVVEAEKPNKEKVEYDIVRRNPGEIHADGRIKFDSAMLAASVAYVLTGQASEQIDEFSLEYVQDGNAKSRSTGGARRNKDHLRLGVGGRFDPTKMVGILGGLSYVAASYAKEEYASLEHENLGGIRLDLGADVQVQKFKGYFQAGYSLDNGASYRVEDDRRASTGLERTQRAPVNDGDKVKITQGSWSLALGGGVTL